jgi:hypothetical protein
MQRKGLCITCREEKTCIFVKEPPVLECEEFSHGNHTPAKFKGAKTKRFVPCEAATESE